MINRVVICGVRRGNSRIPIGDVKQSVGRAGRSYSKSGKAVILVPEEDEGYAWECFDSSPSPVVSRMSDIDSVAFHVLPWLDGGDAAAGFAEWRERTLAHAQGMDMAWGDVREYLESLGMFDDCGVTEFGRLSEGLYLSPARAASMRRRLSEAAADGDATSPAVLSWIMAWKGIRVGDADAAELGLYRDDLRMRGYSFGDGELVHGYACWCLLVNRRPKWLKSVLAEEWDDLPRIFHGISMIAALDNIRIQDKLMETRVAALKRVPPEIARVMTEFSLSAKRLAYELYDLGVSSAEDLDNHADYVVSYGSEALKAALSAGGFMRESAIASMKEKMNEISDGRRRQED